MSLNRCNQRLSRRVGVKDKGYDLRHTAYGEQQWQSHLVRGTKLWRTFMVLPDRDRQEYGRAERLEYL